MLRKYVGQILAITYLMIAAGCSEHSTPSGVEQETTLNPQCGTFGLSSMGKLEKRGAAKAVQAGSNVKFDLGRIKGSSGFFFLLYNVGMTPITNVTLSIDNPAFSVFPSSMDTLIPGSDVGMLPVVKIAAFHGTPYDGVGNRPLLPKGQNQFLLHIAGSSKTVSGTDTVITLDAEMNLEALVMDFSFEGMGGLIEKSGIAIGNGAILPAIDPGVRMKTIYRTSCKNDSIIMLNNTGNVSLHCVFYGNNTILMDSVISSGGTISYTLEKDNSPFHYVLYGDNAVADPARFSLDENGKFYAEMQLSSENCMDPVAQQRFHEYLDAHKLDQGGKIWALIDNSLLIYGHDFANGDSVRFFLHDLLSNVQLSSYSGIPEALSQEDCYNGMHLGMFGSMIGYMLSNDNNGKFAQPKGVVISSMGDTDWVRSTGSVALTNCPDSSK